MPTRRSPVADAAALLLSDAEAVDRATARLRVLMRRLQDAPETPPWFAAIIDAHITAGTIAAADLARAASCLQALSESRAPDGAEPKGTTVLPPPGHGRRLPE
ncbi:hypothetical protein [Actinomadura verrucosospora]|uniref:Uncharacterized protein n=1 Tax=Actinomadura verrucosospora TaxID=46165 RepID=A0A7D3VPV5_ACTVE|nr:hypothetical protein [Actinomadura verrucosospora]QKG19875.1 hypothetical protein ACTIVE_1511 [Actinomadura verrucosospora]